VVYLSELQKGPLYSGLVEEENRNNIKLGSKTGVKIMELKKVTVTMALMVEDEVKEALMVKALI